jgi:hypothetical protein
MAKKFDWTQALLGGALQGTTKYLEGRQKEAAEDRRQRRITEQMKIREAAKKTTKEPKAVKAPTLKGLVAEIYVKMRNNKPLSPQEVDIIDNYSKQVDELGYIQSLRDGKPFGEGTEYMYKYHREEGVPTAGVQQEVQPEKTKWEKLKESLGIKKKDTLGIYGR